MKRILISSMTENTNVQILWGKKFNQITYHGINYSESCKRRNEHINVKCVEETINEEQKKEKTDHNFGQCVILIHIKNA